MGFNLDDYVTVAERLEQFTVRFPEGSIQTDIIELNDKRVVMRASVYRKPDDERPSIAHSALSIPGTTQFTRGSEIENAETSAIGRAIAFLGFEVKKSVASRDEVQWKAGEAAGATQTAERDPDGIIGELVAQGTQDFALRQTPTGWVLPFRIKSGRQSQIVVAEDAIAIALDSWREKALGARVTVHGTFTSESFEKAGRKVEYTVLHLTRIVGPDFELPAVEAGSVPLFTDDDMAAVDAELATA